MKNQEQKIKATGHLKGIFNLAPKAKDPYFSKMPCLCCGSHLASNRYEFTGTAGKKHTDKILHLDCCIDCFEYFFT